MKAAVLLEDGSFRMENIKDPEQAPGEMTMRVKACGVCGSDKRRIMGLDRVKNYPMVLGHEFSGEIVDAGKNGLGYKNGDRVIGIPILSCHICEDCLKGNFHQCHLRQFAGSTCQGAFAEYIALPERNFIKIDEQLTYEEAAMVEPSSVALHALAQADFRSGYSVAVIGVGTIGRLLCQWARILGAKSVCAIDIDEYALGQAVRKGADFSINASDPGCLSQAMALTGGRGFEYVIEAAGDQSAYNLAFQIAAKKGSVCFISMPSGEFRMDKGIFYNIYSKEFKLTSIHMSFSAPFPGREWTLTLEYLKNKRIDLVEGIIHERFTLAEAARMKDFILRGEAKGKLIFRE